MTEASESDPLIVLEQLISSKEAEGYNSAGINKLAGRIFRATTAVVDGTTVVSRKVTVIALRPEHLEKTSEYVKRLGEIPQHKVNALLLNAVYLCGYDVRDLAASLGVSEQSIKGRLSRGVTLIRSRFAVLDFTEDFNAIPRVTRRVLKGEDIILVNILEVAARELTKLMLEQQTIGLSVLIEKNSLGDTYTFVGGKIGDLTGIEEIAGIVEEVLRDLERRGTEQEKIGVIYLRLVYQARMNSKKISSELQRPPDELKRLAEQVIRTIRNELEEWIPQNNAGSTGWAG
ncbi:MAG: hypothetical protein ABIE03_06755 [Patescibacteria group bacterium]|nr:hypothetical protein [Patescibacteria group bacterium]